MGRLGSRARRVRGPRRAGPLGAYFFASGLALGGALRAPPAAVASVRLARLVLRRVVLLFS